MHPFLQLSRKSIILCYIKGDRLLYGAIQVNFKIEEIKKLSKNIQVLYVEDNIDLCKNMQQLLSRVFDNIIIANDGREGYDKFVKFSPKIIITDLNMPIMNGFTMLKKIKALEPECKFIILSAYDDKKHLYKAINLGVFRYLNKPAKAPELVDALYDTVLSIDKDENRRLLLNEIQNIFNYQNNIVVMMFEGKFILPNHRFLEFFGVDSLDEFTQKYDMNSLLYEHKKFLYSLDKTLWYETAVKNPGKLFHTKLENHKGEKRHLILKLRDLPEKEGHSILSFDDITELNLMQIYDGEAANDDSLSQNKKAVLSLMQVVKENAGKVKLHNFYKGLTIINPAIVTEVTEEGVTLKTVDSQLKIVHLTKFTTISSEIFPQDVLCKSINKIDDDNQTMLINDMHFSPRTANDRKYARLEPENNHGCSIFYKNIKLQVDAILIDLSIVSIKVGITSLPAGIEIKDKLDVFMTIKVHNKPTSISIEGTLLRKDENKRSYFLVIVFDLAKKEKDTIQAYMASRQMELIREFKKLNIIESDF